MHVWNVDFAMQKINTLDKMTDVVQDVLVSKDNSIAFVKCRNSDEIGVIDMLSGKMLDLLTHESQVIR